MLNHLNASGRLAEMRQQAFLAEADRNRLGDLARPRAGRTHSLAGLATLVLALIARLALTWRRTRASQPAATTEDVPVGLAAARKP